HLGVVFHPWRAFDAGRNVHTPRLDLGNRVAHIFDAQAAREQDGKRARDFTRHGPIRQHAVAAGQLRGRRVGDERGQVAMDRAAIFLHQHARGFYLARLNGFIRARSQRLRKFRRFLAVQLRQIQPHQFHNRTHTLERFVDKHADCPISACRFPNFQNDLARAFGRHITRTRRIKNKTEHVRACLDCRARVINVRDAANFYNHHRPSMYGTMYGTNAVSFLLAAYRTLRRAYRTLRRVYRTLRRAFSTDDNSLTFSAIFSARIKASPTKTASAPARAARSTSARVKMPLSLTTRQFAFAPKMTGASRSVFAKSTVKSARLRLLMPMMWASDWSARSNSASS